MGTRSLTIFQEADGTEIAVMYRQYDGYPSGHGADLKEFLQDMYLVNGFGLMDTRKIANGMDCLSAQIVAHFKDGPGGFYLMPSGTRAAWEDYRYYISPAKSGRVNIKIVSIIGLEEPLKEHLIYDGEVNDFDPDMEYGED